ncbi:serine/threonine-protein kinase [Streptomyces diastaticus]
MHGDIKPANVLLTTGGKGLLTDFDIGQVEPVTRVTSLVVNAAEYMAPERVSGGGTDSAAGDLFSLGVTLYRAVEGISPFRRDHEFETLMAVRDEEAAPVRCAGALAPLITALLAKDPRDRPTAVEALAMLHGTEAESKALSPHAVPAPEVCASPQAMPVPVRASSSNAALPRSRVPKLPGVAMSLVAVALVAGLGLVLMAGEPLWRTGWGWAGLLGALWIVLTAHRVRAVLRVGANVRQRQANDTEGAPDVGVRRARSSGKESPTWVSSATCVLWCLSARRGQSLYGTRTTT